VEVEGVGENRLLGTTLDDAVGEAFDKAARLLGLAYPGGPEVEAAARAGDPRRFVLPRPMLGRAGADFSFAGLKTALRHAVAGLGGPLGAQDRADLAAGFQAAVAEVLADRAGHALDAFARTHPDAPPVLVLAGGVAANQALRRALGALADARGARLVAPPPALCTDNAAMVAWAGIERLKLGLTNTLDAPARPRWPLAAAR
jgi:N6-L-threonylcarbamoyladenine synthase